MSFFINYLKKIIVSSLTSASDSSATTSSTASATTSATASATASATTSATRLNIPSDSNMINIISMANSARLILNIPSNSTSDSSTNSSTDSSSNSNDSCKRKIDTDYFSETNTNKISKSCQSQFITSQDINEFAKEFKRRNNIDDYYIKRLDDIYIMLNNNIQRIIDAKYNEGTKINGRCYNPIEDIISGLHMSPKYIKSYTLSYIENHDFQHLAYFYKKLNIHIRNLITNIKMYSNSSIQLESIITTYIIELSKLEDELEEKYRKKIWIRI